MLARKAKAISLEEVALMYYRTHADGWGEDHRNQWINSLRNNIFPALGRLAPADIDSAAILKVVEPLWQTKTVTASRVLNRLEAVFDYAATSGFRPGGDNPARGVRSALPKQSRIAKVRHHAAVPYIQVPALMQQLVGRNTLSTAALRFLVFTVGRTDEVRLAMWAEIDLPQRLWTVPAARMKSRRIHRVPLTAPAIEILRALPRLDASDDSERIFPLGKPAMLHALKGCTDGAVTHGLRASFRTWASERTNFPDKIVEAALAHRVGDTKTQTTYERGDLLERRQRLMKQWADFVTAPAATAAVVPLRKVTADA